MNKRLQFFETEPIIAAVKTEEQLERALTSGSNIIFFLFGNICNIPKLVESVKERGKYAFVHLDLINGLAAKEIAADYIRSFTQADGVLSTKPPILRHAKEIGLITVLRVFVLDSLALDNIEKLRAACNPDLIELVPGLMPKIIRQVHSLHRTPLIAGGLIRDKEDTVSALFGQCCFEAGDVKNTYGTGCFLLMHTGSEPVFSKNGLITTIAASGPGRIRYALEGSVFTVGAAVQWLRDEMGLISDAAASEAAARSVTDTGGVYVVPAFTGLGAPYWNQYARGTITGITRGFTRAQLIRATLESIAYQTYDICRAMESDAGVELTRLRVDGGASANDLLMQFQSDLLGAEVLRPACIETTALGAAYLAGLAVGYWKDTADIKQNRQTGRVFLPEMQETTRAKLLKGWNRALTAALTWADMED